MDFTEVWQSPIVLANTCPVICIVLYLYFAAKAFMKTHHYFVLTYYTYLKKVINKWANFAEVCQYLDCWCQHICCLWALLGRIFWQQNLQIIVGHFPTWAYIVTCHINANERLTRYGYWCCHWCVCLFCTGPILNTKYVFKNANANINI